MNEGITKQGGVDCCWMEAKWGWHVRGRLDRRMNKICRKELGRIVED